MLFYWYSHDSENGFWPEVNLSEEPQILNLLRCKYRFKSSVIAIYTVGTKHINWQRSLLSNI